MRVNIKWLKYNKERLQWKSDQDFFQHSNGLNIGLNTFNCSIFGSILHWIVPFYCNCFKLSKNVNRWILQYLSVGFLSIVNFQTVNITPKINLLPLFRSLLLDKSYPTHFIEVSHSFTLQLIDNNLMPRHFLYSLIRVETLICTTIYL